MEHFQALNELKCRYEDLLREEQAMSDFVVARLEKADQLLSLDQIILDYLIRRGYFETATNFAESISLEVSATANSPRSGQCLPFWLSVRFRVPEIF